MAKYIKLTLSQKDEIRRLTQLANRRIKGADKQYKKEGMDVLPSEVVGDKQIREQWETKANPLSRSTKFTSHRDYQKRLKHLQSFERNRPTITEYSDIQRDKTRAAVASSLGGGVPTEIEQDLDKMNAAQLSKFWKTFSDKASKMGIKYASDKAMSQTIDEFFPEDKQNFTRKRRRKRR